MIIAIEAAKETIAVALKVGAMGVDVIEGVVVSPLAIFGLVIDDAIVAFDLARREVPLEVLPIIGGIP
jgi:hypothetical protein